MALEIPASLQDLSDQVTEVVQHTRPASSATEVTNAINWGLGKAYRAIAAVRHQPFQSFVDPFALVAEQAEYDVGLYDPPVWRPHRLLVGAPTGSTPLILFRYAPLSSREFQEAELSRAGTFSTLLYDLLTGWLPGTVRTIQAGATATVMTLDAIGSLQTGSYVSVPGVGPLVNIGGVSTGLRETYRGTVTVVAGAVVTVQPAMSVAPATGVLLTPLRRRVLRIAPTPRTGAVGRLFYQYRPPRLVVNTDLLDPLVAEHRDMVVFYAIAYLLQGVNDGQSRMFFDQAQEMRSELMQAMDPIAGQDGEALQTALDIGDW